MESVQGISHGVQQSASALERFYSSGSLISSHGVSVLQGVEGTDAETTVLQESGEGEEMKNGVMSSLRSPIAGDLASPQQHYIPSSTPRPHNSSTQSSYVAIKVRR